MEHRTPTLNESGRVGEETETFIRKDAANTSEGIKFGECYRWRVYLETVSAVYRSLERERKLGWESKALDWWYEQRKQQQQQPKQTQAQEAVPGGVRSAVVAASDTSFACTDVKKLCERYCAHAARILSSSAPKCFRAVSQASLQGNKHQDDNDNNDVPTFLDLGCAPGGVSKYLVTKLHWCGVGVSLPESRGGIKFDSSWLPSSNECSKYEFIPGSITEDDWHSAIKGRKFYFVNGGAVQDHGQRESAEVPQGDGAAQQQQCALPWFHFLLPQLRLAVEHVEENGVIMLVFGIPQCASLSIILSLVCPFVQGGVHIMETMHLTKSPVYVLLSGVRITHDESSRAAWAHLLEAMAQGTAAFWLGETDEGMRLAKDGFAKHQRELEAVWEKAAAYLRRRRLYAERVMDQVEGGIPKKRWRTDDKYRNHRDGDDDDN